MEFGIGKIAIVHDGSVYIPTNQTALVPDVDDQNTARRSIKTSKVNLRAGWTYYNASVRIKELTVTEIAYFRSLSGKEVRLYPNIDIAGISYYCSVTKAEIKYENGKTWKPYVDLRFDGVYNVAIMTTITAKSITVTSPLLSTWVLDYAFDITWDSVSIAADDLVKIELFKGGVLDSVISASTENNGTFNWTVPTDLATGADYSIRITQLSDLYVYGDSDNLAIDAEYWTDEDGEFILDEKGDPIPIN